MHRVSVIIPVYNRAKQILDCLESLKAQSERDFELILVDDGSQDETGAALEHFKQDNPELKIKIISNEKNLGITKSKNKGIEQAYGEFLLFTDSDCLADPHWVEKLCATLETSDAASGLVLDPKPSNLSELAFFGGAMIQQHQAQKRLLIENNCGFRKDWIKTEKFEEALNYGGEGNELAWRLKGKGARFSFAQDAVIHHRHPLDFLELLKIAIKTGSGESKYFFKRGVFIGRDVLCTSLAIICAGLGTISPTQQSKLYDLALFFTLTQVCLIIASELYFKQKKLQSVMLSLGHNLAYNLAKTLAMNYMSLRILLGLEKEIVRAKRIYKKT